MGLPTRGLSVSSVSSNFLWITSNGGWSSETACLLVSVEANKFQSSEVLVGNFGKEGSSSGGSSFLTVNYKIFDINWNDY